MRILLSKEIESGLMKQNNLIEGLKITDLKEISDPKGSVLHMLRNDDELFKSFGECYFSEVNSGHIKGWKKHSIQSQNISVPIGKVRFVLYDPRENSDTYQTISLIDLGRPNNYKRLHIPPGLWYSFQSISSYTSLIVNCADIPHSPKESKTLPIDTKLIPYSW